MLKKWLQDWLGITALANKLVDNDAKLGATGYTAEHFYAIPIEDEEQAYITEEIKKGYES